MTDELTKMALEAVAVTLAGLIIGVLPGAVLLATVDHYVFSRAEREEKQVAFQRQTAEEYIAGRDYRQQGVTRACCKGP